MLIQAVGAVLPAAMAVALSPFPVIGIVLILAGERADRNGPLFAVGWTAGLAIVATAVVTLFSGADNPDSTSSGIADWGRVAIGAALIVLGARKWWLRPREGDSVEEPGWMASLDDASAGRALALGALLSGANPKNFVLTASAASSIAEAGKQGGERLLAVIIFVLIASCTVLGALAVHFAGGRRGASLLDRVRQFMVSRSTTITVIVLLLIGSSVLGDGLEGLGR